MSPLLRSTILVVLMVLATALAYGLTPRTKLADLQPRESLDLLVPMQFGDWRGIPANNIVLTDPQMRANLERLYTSTLNRTYVDAHGRQIMLMIAYGDNERDGMEMHYPEICYPAQGFHTRSKEVGALATPFGAIQVKRLEMVQGSRDEFVTYWTMIGDHATLGGTGKKLAEMRYSLKGVIPDGMLFRVSSIDSRPERAYRDHAEFVRALLGALSPDARKRLAGV